MSATAALRFVEILQAASPVRRNTYCQELIRLITSSNDVVELEPGDVVSYVATLDQTMAIPREGQRVMRKIPFNTKAIILCVHANTKSGSALGGFNRKPNQGSVVAMPEFAPNRFISFAYLGSASLFPRAQFNRDI
jgi:hypothetical protein